MVEQLNKSLLHSNIKLSIEEVTNHTLGTCKYFRAHIPVMQYQRLIDPNLTTEEANFIYHESIPRELLTQLHFKEVQVLRDIYPILRDLQVQGVDASTVEALSNKLNIAIKLLTGIPVYGV